MSGAAGADRAPAGPVSVVVPCYRCADTIGRAVRSVAAQSLRPAELILVDDGSQDGTGAALERLRAELGADWIRIVSLARNVGSASARNAGWQAASQPYVAFLDADDAWHPRKIEIQYTWMAAHPEVAVSGHRSRQLRSEAEIPADPGGGEAQPIARRALFASNQFITPSVMLRRDIPQRFEDGKRYMEDYLLWLEVAADGGMIARLPQVLAFTFKAPFGEAGLSARPWKMEQGELAVFASLWRKGRLGSALWLLLSGFSLLKFLRRVLMLSTGYSPSSAGEKPSLLYPAAYLVLTQSMTALLIIAGLAGATELAAELGVVQAATLATFFALSGNARNLILTERASVPRGALVVVRLLLLVPLGVAAALLCVIIGRFDPTLIAVLVARRGIEWIGELHLSESELLGRRDVARNSLLSQSVLLALAAGAIALDSAHLIGALAAWALLPALPLIGFLTRVSARAASLRSAAVLLLPHLGSTAASGMSLYAFRVLLVLVAGKAVAGDLFAAFAIGSFPGSMFANVLGPSVSLHQERVGRSYLPKGLWMVTSAYLLCGIALLALHWTAPMLLATLGKSGLFWTALGWSLIGGVIMIVAQRVRLRLIASGDGRDVFGADVLVHVCLIAAVPALYAMVRTDGLALLYVLNAVLALLFYASGVRGQVAPYGTRAAQRLDFGVVFFVFVPVFFLATGKLFNPADPLFDSGGLVRNLPLPISLLACTGGLLLYGRYANATPGLWAIFGMLVLMLISTAVAGGESDSLGPAKMLLLLQILLPMFGLVLGSVLDPDAKAWSALRLAILAVIALVVPAQLAASWLDGSLTLRHSVFFFGVYQHLQFVPVILASAYLVALPGLWERWGATGKIALSFLLACLAVYAVGAYSVLAMFAVLGGTALWGGVLLLRGSKLSSALMAIAVYGCFGLYCKAVTTTYEFQTKFSFLVAPDDSAARVGGYSAGIKPRLVGGWRILSLPYGGDLLYVDPLQRTRGTLVVEGELESGEISFLVENTARTVRTKKGDVTTKGPFRAEVPYDRDRDEKNIVIFQPFPNTRGILQPLRWQVPESDTKAKTGGFGLIPEARAAAAEEPAAGGVRNVAERFSDWLLFGHGIVESPKALLFGHAQPLAREQRTSAHNFYIDFVYNFGVLALLPLLTLIVYTGVLLWQRRSEVVGSETLFALAAVVAFLLLVESNLKVSLRQPYPGIAIYFLWGLLLARLRAR